MAPAVWGYNGTWNSTQVDALTNQYYTVVFGIGCQTSDIQPFQGPDPQYGVYPPIYDPNAGNFSSINIGAHWLFNPNGGSVAYVGENVVMADDAGAGFVSSVFNERNNGYQRIGDMYRMAQEDYFNANFVQTIYSQPIFDSPRIYLSIENLLGDPSMRVP